MARYDSQQEIRVLSTGTLLFLSLPSLLFAGFDLARRSYLPVFLTHASDASLQMVAIVVAITGFWGVAVEFAVSLIGDREARSVGLRPFWIAIGTGIIVISTLALAAIGAGSRIEIITALLLLLIGGWTLCNVTHGAWALETGRTGKERAAIFGLRSFCAVIGGTGFALLAAAITAGAFGPGLSPFVAILIATGIGIPVLHGLLIWRVPSRKSSGGTRNDAALLAPLHLLFANEAHRRITLLFLIIGVHGGIGAATFLIFARDGLGLAASADLILGVATAASAIGALASARWGAFWRRESMLKVLMGTKVILAVVLLGIEAGQPIILAIWSMVGGVVGSFNFLVLRLLLGEALDAADEQNTGGQPKGAMFYAAFHIPLNIGLTAGGALALAALGWAGHESPAIEFEQTSRIAVLIPALLLLASALAGFLSVRGLQRIMPVQTSFP